MKILHVFLYVILSVCIIWGLAIISGPSLIEFFVRQKYEESVKISGLKVSARLSVYASRVDFYNSKISPRWDVSGHSRSVRLEWGNIFSDQPFVDLSIGPTTVDGIGEFKNFSVRSKIAEISDFSKEQSEMKIIDANRRLDELLQENKVILKVKKIFREKRVSDFNDL